MWNFLELLDILAGGFSAYYLGKKYLDDKGKINAQDAGFLILAFFGGIISLIWLVSEEGDKIVLFKKPSNSQPEPQAQAQAAPQPMSQPAPSQAKQRSVLDG